ncbi:DUF2141 domain-containing protein [Sphingomonas sp. SUN039]|uniref:DUF2141 domain-containing protein n=1 Tax=Sphingomonas sp. SUN039 TaxID=2937787 RepID=UPI0021646E09|nr:DUF2141 domain-containing protein [Sphingomonas sp. SUN039]UVO55390.1 DUF2141 domain-containing protein [Sphingomonas sp. SUN039]
MKKLLILSALLPVAAFAQVPSSPNLGMAEGRCRPGESGPSFIVTLVGLKDRAGNLKAELYPANDTDFLADDNVLLNAGKTFRRVVVDVPQSGPVQICIRAPAAGTYGLTVLHDRDKDRKFNLSRTTGDGIGFGGNPTSQGPFKPKIAIARATVGNGPTPVNVIMLYRTGWLSLGRLKAN